jgi:hypothetical protein
MATTTNYGWDTPDDTDLVKDGAAAIRTLGSSVDTTTKALNPSTTEGDIEYRSATANTNTRLGIGTAGQVLTVNSGADAPEWQTLNAGGMTLISTTTLSGASTTLSSIPQTYNNLQLVIRNVDNDTNNRILNFRFNGATANQNSRDSNNALGLFNQASAGLGSDINDVAVTGLWVVDIPDYTNTTTWKFIISKALYPDSSTPTSFQMRQTMGMYNQTGALTSIELLPTSGNFSGGTALLYGVK